VIPTARRRRGRRGVGLLALSCAAVAACRLPDGAPRPTPDVAPGGSASFRGLSVPRPVVAWASGSGGTLVLTEDGGRTWRRLPPPPGGAELDFRDVVAWDARNACALAAGPGAASGLWSTTDAGRTWTALARNADPDGFWDDVAFWDRQHGLLVGDPVGGALFLARTEDGGRTWIRVGPGDELPAPVTGEYVFAASGSSLRVAPGGLAWLGTGGAVARVWRSEDGGRTWTAAETPLTRSGGGGEGSAGVFALAFRDERRGVAVGGDWRRPDDRAATAAWTEDGGRTWSPAEVPPGGYRSGACWWAEAGVFLATGPNGTDVSEDGGRTWRPLLDSDGSPVSGFHTAEAGWLAGSGGRVLRLDPTRAARSR